MLLIFISVISICVTVNAVTSSNWKDIKSWPCKTFCESVICEKITHCSTGDIVRNSSYCNCCDSCINTLEKHDACEEPLGSLDDFKKPKCIEGLNCIKGVCSVGDNSTKCMELQYTIRTQQNSEEAYADDIWIPECDNYGNFKAKQHKKRKTMCVDTLGKQTFGQEEPEFSQNMSCGCSLYMDQKQKQDPIIFWTQPQEHCSEVGNFESLQCIDDLCYCTDSITGDVNGRMVKRDYINKLPCYSKEIHGDGYLKPCEEELLRLRHLRFEFHQKGLDVFGIDRVKCDYDGSFSPTQCDSTRCVCTNRNGVGINSYQEDYQKITSEMTCNCAREVDSVSSHSQYPTLNCRGYGNFYQSQCFQDNQCFCVDEDGDVISKVLNKSTATESYCRYLLNNLYGVATITTVDDATITTVTEDVDDTSDDDDYYIDDD